MRSVVLAPEFLYTLKQNITGTAQHTDPDKYHADIWSVIFDLSNASVDDLKDIGRFPIHDNKRLATLNDAVVVWSWSDDELHVHGVE